MTSPSISYLLSLASVGIRYANGVFVRDDRAHSKRIRNAILASEAGGGGAIAPVIVTAPNISQYASVGSPLMFTRGTYTGTVTSYTQQWLKAGVPISGATGTTYTPVSGDNPSNISVLENAVNSGTSSANNISNGTVFATMGVFLGDSYVVGQQASVQSKRWTTLTATALGLTELNQGVAGTILQNSTFINSAPGVAQVNNGRGRFVATLLGANQRMRTYIAYGFNDYRYVGGLGTDGSGTGCTQALYQSNFRQVLNGLIAQGVRPGDIVIVGPYWMTDTGLGSGTAGFIMTTNLGSISAARAQAISFVATALALAVEYGTLYVDGYAAMAALGASSVGTDNIHPTDAGYAAIAAAAETPVVANAKPVPTGVAAVKSASGAMTVTWGAPALISGVTVTNYTVEYGLKSSTGVTPFTTTGTTSVSALTNTFTGLADGWYVARVKANFSDSTSSPWAWFIAGASVDARTTDTTTISTDFRAATIGVNVETISPWTKLGSSTSSEVIGGSGAGTRGFDTPEVLNGKTANQTYLYKAGNISVPSSGSLFGEFLVSYLSSATGNANESIMLQGNSALTQNGIMVLYNDASFRIFKETAGTLATATGTTTGTVALQPGLDYLWRLEVSSGTQKAYLNNALICQATEPIGGAWGTEVGWRMANTSFLATDLAGTHIKTVRFGTTV